MSNRVKTVTSRSYRTATAMAGSPLRAAVTGTKRHSHFVPILLQKSLPVSVRGDSIALMRFATEAGDDGATQSRSKTAFLFIPSRGCGSRRSFGPNDCWGSRPVMGACRACTVLSKAWETFDRSGAYGSDAGRWLRFCDSLGTSTLPGRTSQSCLPLVLWPFNRRQGSRPFRVLACTQRAVPQHRRFPHRIRACRGSVH